MNKNLIYLPMWTNVLDCIEENKTKEKIAIESNTTLSHGLEIIKELTELGLVENLKRKGRTAPIKLTKKGIIVKENLRKINKAIKNE